MAVGNSLTAKKQNSDRVEFEVAGEKITLTPQIVRDYLVSGDKERVSMQEVVMFINLCKYAGLNPWLKEQCNILGRWKDSGRYDERWSCVKVGCDRTESGSPGTVPHLPGNRTAFLELCVPDGGQTDSGLLPDRSGGRRLEERSSEPH